MTKPSISVIIPAYNEEKLIGRTLSALRAQTMPAAQFEIILVDNDSKDNTAKIAQQAGVKVIHYIDKHTVGAVRNAGAEQAIGEILAFIDADTIPTNTWLEDINKMFIDTKVNAIGGVGLPDQGNFIDWCLFQSYNLFCKINQLFGVVLVAGFNLAVRREQFMEIGGFDEELLSMEDIDLINRIRRHYGRDSGQYTSRVRVYTSTRKFKKGTFSRYIHDGATNYLNIIRGKQTKGQPMITVR